MLFTLVGDSTMTSVLLPDTSVPWMGLRAFARRFRLAGVMWGLLPPVVVIIWTGWLDGRPPTAGGSASRLLISAAVLPSTVPKRRTGRTLHELAQRPHGR
ncbi:hypothetical protein ACFPRL_12135 [Pseudoclavibacter helvolus]